MLHRRLVLALVMLAASLAPVASAQTPDSGIESKCATPYPVAAGANTGGGFINFCAYYPTKVQPGSTFEITSILTAPTTVVPVFLGATSAFVPVSGCTEGTPALVVPTTNGVVGTIWTAVSTLTMTAEQCGFLAQVSLTVGATPLQIYFTGIDLMVYTENVRVDNFNFICDDTNTNPNAYNPATTNCIELHTTVDNFNRLCAASAYNTTCTTATINAAITGTLTATLSGTLDILDRLCNASATGTSCTTPTLNAIISGTLDTLNRLCDDSALGSACNEVHFTADLLTRLCAASAYNTTCTAPTITAALNGALTIHQDQACGTTTPCSVNVHQDQACGAVTHCHFDIDGFNVTLGNISNVVNVDKIHVCGPQVVPGDCTPVVASATANVNIDTLLLICTIFLIGAYLFGATRLVPLRIAGILIDFWAGFRALQLSTQLYGGPALGYFLMMLASLFFLYLAITGLRDALNSREDRKARKAAKREKDSQDYDT